MTDEPEQAAATPAAAEDAPPIFTLENAWLGYGRTIILEDVSFEVRPGDFWCFVGANGTGKTTLIKALLGALTPRLGKIERRTDFAGRNRVGYVPQALELNRTLPTTVGEFILSGLAGMRSDSVLRKSRLKAVLEHVGLTRASEADFWSLSGGQRQRAMVARALIRDPKILIVDEPLAGLDMAAARQAVRLMVRLNAKHGIAIIFVSHDLQLVADRATHVAMFRDGTVTADTAQAQLTTERLTQTFGVPIEVSADRKISFGPDPADAEGQAA